MPGLGAAFSNVLKSGVGKELVQQAESAAVQQAGAQVAAGVMNAPHTLRAKLAGVEQYATSPVAMGGTFLDGWFPEFSHSIHVAAAGGPDASIKDVWRLVVATTFGRFRQRIATFSGCRIECTWDITDKAVSMRLSYGSNGLIPVLIAGAGLQGGMSAVEVIQKGPSSETVGAGWSGFLQTYAQLLGKGSNNASAIGGRMTPRVVEPNPNPTTPGDISRSGRLEREDAFVPGVLPDDGRLITTENYANPQVQPPRPANYQDFVGIVSAALTNPCILPCKPPRGHQVANPSGYRFYNAGNPPDNKDNLIDRAERIAALGVQKGDATGGIDGYPPVAAAQNPTIPNECTVQIAELRANPNQAEPEA